ncbi:hypothetical protein [Oceanisphaera arctica]|uniref:Uncharacterized protein n=1 Tax=Oceanisphaera arctica TaxID=641510 RepID=A0A2P5TK43_9GAMM|nr:hypothetical protein [Oceanisphaera arctica]PPL15474.1 hypothetical protein UN63_12410 [Oceanisphaera arctica]GHA05398.1 hypothetical protein GCM10007082_02870 [Oceanisphaera arctica]
MSIITKLEQMLCPHEHHLAASGEVRCAMCGHVNRPLGRRATRNALLVLALVWASCLLGLACLIREAA